MKFNLISRFDLTCNVEWFIDHSLYDSDLILLIVNKNMSHWEFVSDDDLFSLPNFTEWFRSHTAKQVAKFSTAKTTTSFTTKHYYAHAVGDIPSVSGRKANKKRVKKCPSRSHSIDAYPISVCSCVQSLGYVNLRLEGYTLHNHALFRVFQFPAWI